MTLSWYATFSAQISEPDPEIPGMLSIQGHMYIENVLEWSSLRHPMKSLNTKRIVRDTLWHYWTCVYIPELVLF